MAKISTSVSGVEAADRLAKSAPVILRDEVRKALRKAGQVVIKRAKQLVPPPGYPGDKPGLKPLRDTIGQEIKDGRTTYFTVVGPKYPAGAHGYLVEVPHQHFSHGQPTGGMTEPHPFMEPAAESTKPQQRQAMVKILEELDKKLGRSSK